MKKLVLLSVIFLTSFSGILTSRSHKKHRRISSTKRHNRHHKRKDYSNHKEYAERPEQPDRSIEPTATPAPLAEKKTIPIGVLDVTKGEDVWPLIMQMHEFVRASDVRAILVRLGGGRSLGSAYALFEEFKAIDEQKPVIVLIESQCIYGCYYIAAGARKIVASPTAIVGNIGAEVVIERFDNARLQTNSLSADLNTTLFSQGKFKKMFNQYSSPLTPEEEEHANQLVKDLYDQMCEDIAQKRGLAMEERNVWADGKVFIGKVAALPSIRLVDELGSFSDACNVIRNELKERGQDAEGDIVLVFPEDSRNQEQKSL